MNNTELKKMTVTAIFIAIGVLLAPFVSFPFGGARVFPLQHLINVLLSVLVGWRYSTAGAFCISSIRIAMGVGTVLAYPGSMIGAALSGVLYKKTNLYFDWDDLVEIRYGKLGAKDKYIYIPIKNADEFVYQVNCLLKSSSIKTGGIQE